MKHILLTLLMLISMNVAAQTQRYFCKVSGLDKGWNTTIKSFVFDFGQTPSTEALKVDEDKNLVDEKDQPIKFKGMAEVANYMESKGWKFQQAYSSSFPTYCIDNWVFYKDVETHQ